MTARRIANVGLTPRGARPAQVALTLSLALVAVVLCALALPRQATGAGMVTHAFMADEAVKHVTTPELKAILELHHQELLSGASYPDGGYAVSSVPGGDYGEVSHWEGFTEAYAAHIRNKSECGDLSNPLGPCAPLIAHMMGTAAHGMGDEMWDWMFEPLTVDHHEHPDHPSAPPDVPPGSLINNIEYAMDMIALVDHFRWTEQGLYLPPPTDLTAVYASIGRSDITPAGIAAGHGAMEAALTGERAAAPTEAERVRQQMPWSAAHFHTESGGVLDSAEAIAGYYEALWAKLTAQRPPPWVVAVHPEDGEQNVPTVWQPPRTSPGPHSGGGELRVIAVLSSAVDPSSVNASSFELLDPSGDPVPPLEGFPKAGPYHTSDGTHSLLFYPAVDLEPCAVYTARAGTGLRDRAGLAPAETTWEFRTRSADPSSPCPNTTRPPDDGPDPGPDPGAPSEGPVPRGERCLGKPATIIGGPGAERLRGTARRDVIVSRGGRDRVRSGPGADLICAGSARDSLSGGRGEDTVVGGAGNDLLRGRGGADRMQGGRGANDRCRGGSAGDVVRSCEVVLGVP